MKEPVTYANRMRGKIAVVTGAGSGIGAATAERLAAEGAAVVVADIVAAAAAAVTERIRAAGGVAIARVADVGEADQVEHLIGEAVRKFGGVDLLHNNAAAMQYTTVDPPITEIDLAVWNHQLAVNLTAPMLASKFAIPHMIKRGGGAIVHTASVESIRASDSRSGYATTKAAMLGLSRLIAVQYGKHGVRSNVIMPGPTFGDDVRARIGERMYGMFTDHVMTPTTSQPPDQAAVVAFLMSDEAWFINGQEIAVDGGLTCYLPTVPALRRLALKN